MKRWFCLSLLAALLLAARLPAAAGPGLPDASLLSRTEIRSDIIVRAADGERRFFFWRRRAAPDSRDSRVQPDARPKAQQDGKPVGARFWGGPYWGYGTRLGHPCQTCSTACKGGEQSAACDRCRSRCGW